MTGMINDAVFGAQNNAPAEPTQEPQQQEETPSFTPTPEEIAEIEEMERRQAEADFLAEQAAMEGMDN